MKDKHYPSYVENLPSLEGKVVAITGTTSGTGYWTAVAAIRKNASLVLLLNRKSGRSEESEAKLKEEAKTIESTSEIQTVECNLMSLASVREAAEQVASISAERGGLDALICNAGIMGYADTRTDDGFEVQMQTNHISHFLLTKLLMKSFQEAAENRGEARIVQHSSGARNMYGPFEGKYLEKCDRGTLGKDSTKQRFVRYHHTKLANMLFTMALNKRLNERGITNIKATVADPGIADTDIVTNTKNQSGFFRTAFFSFMKAIIPLVAKMQSAADGALPLIEASFGEEVDGGDFFIPKQTVVGVPKKVIMKGEALKPEREKFTIDETSQETLWTKSEEAIGESFFES